jgi:hypothetical protein
VSIHCIFGYLVILGSTEEDSDAGAIPSLIERSS